MSVTPGHISEKVDVILDRLNGTYGLRLPRLHKADARQSVNNPTSSAKRCSSRIRFLCYRNEARVDSALVEFEELAKARFSHWIFKPNQEKGTLPSLPDTSSFLKRDVISQNANNMTAGIRDQLLELLARILDEEFALVQSSDTYSRGSSGYVSKGTSRSTSFATAAMKQTLLTPYEMPLNVDKQQGSELASNKRRKTSVESQSSKRSRIQGHKNTEKIHSNSIQDHFKVSKPTSPSSTHENLVGHNIKSVPLGQVNTNDTREEVASDLVTSFNTAVSSAETGFSHNSSTSFTSDTSNDTSIISSPERESQSYFDTQEHNEYMADVSFCSTLYAADNAVSAATFSFDDINSPTPFKTTQHLPVEVAFWLRWEIYRVAQNMEIAPISLHKAIENHQIGPCPTYEEFWHVVCDLCRDAKKTIPPKSDVRPWLETTNTYSSPDGYSAYFNFTLEYYKAAGPQLWNLKLNPIKVDKCNRIHRKFGADRHLIGFLNYFDHSSLPRWVTQRRDFDSVDAFKKIAIWLATETHRIAGREWRAFFLEPEKKKTKSRSGEAPRQKLSLFAVDGIDFGDSLRRHQPVSIYQFVDWHIPIRANLQSTNLKLFSRFALALSRTKATATLEPDQFHFLPDSQPVMNDGCALMSMNMAKEIWKICGDGTTNVPSAFQGRLGGGKGLWIVDYHNSKFGDQTASWIEISDSQLKIKPHPRDRLDADMTQRTFEVLKWSTPCTPGHLNIQLINILVDRGVPRSVLREAVLYDIKGYIDASRNAMQDPHLLAAWLQEYHAGDRYEQSYLFEDGLPDTKEDAACLLVQSGFTAENCEYLRQEIIALMATRLNAYVERLKIRIPHSTSTFCVPDPYGVLEEDEVYLGFSNHWKNPKTGLNENALIDIDVLVARNPAALASDIQKRKAVYKHELRHFKDIIIFPTKGKEPLASLLSGGDYDGDTVTVIWDPILVDHFSNALKPALPSEQHCGLRKVSVRLADMIHGTDVSDQDVDEFLSSCIEFNAQPNRLGISTNEHEKLVYNGVGLSDQGAILLAALNGYLVDANKQGLIQTDSAWSQVRRAAQGGRRLLPLAYRNGQDTPRRRENDRENECVNIIDHLKFDVAMKRKDDCLAEFEMLLPNAQKYDRDLTMPFRYEDGRSRDESDPDQKSVGKILDTLKQQLHIIRQEWSKLTQNRGASSDRNLQSDIHHISNLINNVVPIRCDCDIYHDFARNQNLVMQNVGDSAMSRSIYYKGTRWSLLRASTMYAMFYRSGKIPWWTVGDELCRIKARSLGVTRELTPMMHHLLKVDVKKIKRLTGGTTSVDENEADEVE